MMNYNPYLNSGMYPAQRLMEYPHINATFVTNLQEAQAQPVGINTTNVAIDNTNNKIYLKRMDNNGISATKTYIPQEDISSPVSEFNSPDSKKP